MNELIKIGKLVLAGVTMAGIGMMTGYLADKSFDSTVDGVKDCADKYLYDDDTITTGKGFRKKTQQVRRNKITGKIKY